ncbi:MAG: helix-turn-helix domain-containing protein [Verrucomicrobia bacterium]|nr:helix-turn-helix domain-containing protein [Verrucomicrobiota bacterium]
MTDAKPQKYTAPALEKGLDILELLSSTDAGLSLSEIARDLGLAHGLAEAPEATLSFGPLEPLVCLMQETPADRLLPLLAARLRSGTDLRQLVAAGALANARTFGGEDYVGFHTLMAISPAFHMAQEMPAGAQALPVLKVLHRNTRRIQEHGGRQGEVLHAVPPAPAASDVHGRPPLPEAIRRKETSEAEQTLSALAAESPEDALNELLVAVQDQTEVHRVVLPYRAWDLLGIIGREQATTLLRQSVRYCVRAEGYRQPATADAPRTLLPRLLEEHRLLDRTPGVRSADEAWIGEFSETLFRSTPGQAAAAAAAALAEGMAPGAVGEAITLAANQLVLRDLGRPPRDESPGKPTGSVHGDSIGVHATDSANAWRNLARVSNARNGFASLILGAYQVAIDRTARGGDFLQWAPLPYGWQYEQVKGLTDTAVLLRETDEAIRGNLQARASALVHCYGAQGGDPRPVFDLLLRYAVSEDGALHGEKFYRTCSEEFATTHPAFRWRHLVALARVTASEHGRPAPGVAEARSLLRLDG